MTAYVYDSVSRPDLFGKGPVPHKIFTVPPGQSVSVIHDGQHVPILFTENEVLCYRCRTDISAAYRLLSK